MGMLREDAALRQAGFHSHHTHLGVAAIMVIATLALRAGAVTPPPGFQVVPFSPALVNPVAMAIASDGRIFVAEQRGLVKVLRYGVKIATFIDLRNEVCGSGDRG